MKDHQILSTKKTLNNTQRNIDRYIQIKTFVFKTYHRLEVHTDKLLTSQNGMTPSTGRPRLEL